MYYIYNSYLRCERFKNKRHRLIEVIQNDSSDFKQLHIYKFYVFLNTVVVLYIGWKKHILSLFFITYDFPLILFSRVMWTSTNLFSLILSIHTNISRHQFCLGHNQIFSLINTNGDTVSGGFKRYVPSKYSKSFVFDSPLPFWRVIKPDSGHCVYP